ncbi:MAG TPA: AAA family ATPase [Xanthobacteraceae bacterium]|jgi:predicted kinase
MMPFTELVPATKNPAIDWQTMADAFDWFRRLADCPQDPAFHAEGDVGIHTRMVVEALIGDPAWQRSDAEARASLFWAALLHDVAKPDCTRRGPDGRLTSPGHSRRGQIIARRILWSIGAPFRQREQICHLITHHQVPFYLIERERPQRRLHAISLQTRCDLLTILAKADANGRICAGRSRLIDNVELFAALARDEACYAQPKHFASAHSRFLYFRKEDRAADYEAYDDWDGHATLLSGLPAAGKSTWLAANAGNATVVSLDDLREELDVEADEPQGAVVAAARERARGALRATRPLIWSATNLGHQRRASLIDLCADYRAKVRIIYFETSEAEARHRNAARDRPVPMRVLERMLDRWEPPDITECHALDVCLT